MKKYVLLTTLLVLAVMVAACAAAPAPTTVPPTSAPPPPPPPTAVPPTQPPPPTAVPATAVPATTAPTAAAATPTTPPPACDKLPSAPTVKAGDVGSADKPIIITFVPSGDVGRITKAGTSIAECLSKMTGLNYKIEVGTTFGASIEAMGAGKAQVGFLNTFSLLLAKQKYDIDIALAVLRKYQTSPMDPDKDLKGKLTSFYRGEFIANKKSGIKTIADLKGKTFCFVDPNSTSGYIIPRIELKANGVDPDKDLKATQNAGSHDNVAIAVYKGDCDAGSTFQDIRTDSKPVQQSYPDILDKVDIFYVTGRIPNDGVQYVKDLDAKIKQATTDGLLAMAKDPGGAAVLASLYTIQGLEKVDYSFYKDFEALLKKAGVDPATLVK